MQLFLACEIAALGLQAEIKIIFALWHFNRFINLICGLSQRYICGIKSLNENKWHIGIDQMV